MPRITYIESTGRRHEVEAPIGISVMEAARQHGIPGIVALCAGACACATCHVYVDARWRTALAPPEDMEEGMLDNAWQRRAGSRLSCQLPVTASMDGLLVEIPERQA
jgi:2Fe-2S ferredoxin